jgi:hypothetical protein
MDSAGDDVSADGAVRVKVGCRRRVILNLLVKPRGDVWWSFLVGALLGEHWHT